MKGKCLAIIPARSGSKGLKDKNIALLGGKPLLAYSIEAALESKCFSHICVSTDSQIYADIALSFGAEIPCLRSAATSSDTASSWDVVKEVVNCYSEIGLKFEKICLLQPTSPLRDSADIQRAFAFFNKKKALFVESLVEMDHSPLWANTLNEDCSLKDFIKPMNNLRRQELPTYYRENGAIYLFKTIFLSQLEKMYCSKSYGYIMEKAHSIDIDTEEDLLLANILINRDRHKILQIRPAVNTDFEFYYKLKTEPESIYWSGFSSAPNKEKLNNWFGLKMISSDYHLFIAEWQNENELIPVGYLAIYDSDKNPNFAETSHGVISSMQGKGFGTQIIFFAKTEYKRLGYSKLLGYINRENIGSQINVLKNKYYPTGYNKKIIFHGNEKLMIEYEFNE